jgi:RTA1 like protein
MVIRIPEMASGWGSDLMKDEISFLILDGAMILGATALLSIIHPAKYFPQLSAKGPIKEEGLATPRK